MSKQKPTPKPKATQGETPSVLPGSREERAYRQAILEHINALLAIPPVVCKRWEEELQRKLHRTTGDFPPALFRLLLILINVMSAHRIGEDMPRTARRTAA